jgi:hypothetical protein
MEPAEPHAPTLPISPPDPLKELTGSARGWHTIQMAVLGFTGLCGVLHTVGSPAPRAVQVLAATLAAIAVVVACLAVLLVGQVAYPVAADSTGPGAAQDLARARSRLRSGIGITVGALLIAVLATLSGWWPAQTTPTAPSAVELTSTAGQAWCGTLATAPPNTIRIHSSYGIVTLPAREVLQFRVVAHC